MVVSVVGGVDWQDTHYADVMDTEWMEAFGIGPGCESEHARAVPPVRLRELSEEFGEQAQWGESSTFSMCGYDWSPAIACLPGPDLDVDPCVELCLADVDPRTPEVEFDCRVEWTDPDGHTLVLPPCNSERPWIPDDAEACGQVLPPGENLCPDPALPDFAAGFRERRGGCLSFTCQTAPQEVCDQRPLELYVASD